VRLKKVTSFSVLSSFGNNANPNNNNINNNNNPINNNITPSGHNLASSSQEGQTQESTSQSRGFLFGLNVGAPSEPSSAWTASNELTQATALANAQSLTVFFSFFFFLL